MAMSAFRSTTRRGCGIGAGSAEVSGVPSTPRSKRDPSPSGRGFHRRSTSMTDFSKYLSDCSSTTEYRSSYDKSSGIKGGRRSVCPSDSESDMECLSVHRRRHQRWGAESEDERPLNPPFSVTNAADSQRRGLRRTLSSQDLSQHNSKPRQHIFVLDKKPEGDDTEDLVEEKTIRAVYAQMKSLRSDPPVGDVGMTDFLDAMRLEVRRAVADIRMDLEESMQKNGKLSSTLDEGNRLSQGTDVIQAVADIQKEYSTKLEESEKRVRELWSQIAVEERRCLELSKIVKELLPTPPPSDLQSSTSHVSSNRRRPLRRKNSAEKQLVLKSLDDEAQKYFEECVSISSFECQGESDNSLHEKENSSRHRKGRLLDGEIGAKSPSAESDAKSERQPKDSLIGSDGVVLPWLQWESEAGGGGDKTPKQAAKKHVPEKNSSSGSSSLFNGSSNEFYRSGNNKLNAVRKPAARISVDFCHVSQTASIAASFGGGGDVHKTVPDKLVSELQACKTSSMSLFTVDDRVVRTDHYFLDVDTLLFEKIRFRCRVENGELLLCQGLFLM